MHSCPCQGPRAAGAHDAVDEFAVRCAWFRRHHAKKLAGLSLRGARSALRLRPARQGVCTDLSRLGVRASAAGAPRGSRVPFGNEDAKANPKRHTPKGIWILLWLSPQPIA